tara:strand:- start:1 stop:405 length:405 start_codon:yes stop_codon:yes gene_type:complete
MDYLIIFLSFVLGIVASRIFTITIAWAQLIGLVRAVEKDCLFMLASVSESVAYIQTIKVKTMIDLEMNEKNIESMKSIDEHNFSRWKESAVNNLHSSYPVKFRNLPKYYNWQTAMDFLDKVYFQNRKSIDKSDN